jgi:hypothetical protein
MGSDKQSIYPLNGDEGYEDALATEIVLKWTNFQNIKQISALIFIIAEEIICNLMPNNN